MKYIEKAKAGALDFINKRSFGIIIICLCVYLTFMLIAPLLTRDWTYIQEVWDRWQALNVGVLAFASSIIAFNISKYRENEQRERRFIAARAFLPHALSELTSYCESSSTLLREAWNVLVNTGESRTPLKSRLPKLPESYKETFSRCISDASPDVADYMASILVKLQVHNSRLENLRRSFGVDGFTVWNERTIMIYLYGLGELHALISRLFDYARGEKDFDDSRLLWKDYYNTYCCLDIHTEGGDDLKEYTLQEISRDI